MSIYNTGIATLIGSLTEDGLDRISDLDVVAAESEEEVGVRSNAATLINNNRVTSGLGVSRLNVGLTGVVSALPDLDFDIVVRQTQEYAIGTPSRPWGAIYAQNGVIQTSDMNKKRLIKESELGLSFVMALKPVSFAWRNSGSTTPVFGFLGQDVEKALGGKRFSGLKKGDEGYSLRYVDFIAPMVKAMQQQQQQIEILKKEIATLKLKLS